MELLTNSFQAGLKLLHEIFFGCEPNIHPELDLKLSDVSTLREFLFARSKVELVEHSCSLLLTFDNGERLILSEFDRREHGKPN